MADKKEALNQALIEARVSLDEAVKKLQGGERLTALTPGQLERVRAKESINTGCTNTGCGKPALEDVISQPS